MASIEFYNMRMPAYDEYVYHYFINPGYSDTIQIPRAHSCEIKEATYIMQLLSRQQFTLNRISIAVFRTKIAPGERNQSLKAAHERFPVYMRDPNSK